MPKNIVICFDGTGEQFGKNNSNVVKLYQLLQKGPEQVAYYHPGLGTMGAKNALSNFGKARTRLFGLAFGYGISENIADAYAYLMDRYEPGDRVYLFGFSRGAYTARAFAGILKWFGLLSKGNESLIPYIIRMAKKKKKNFGIMTHFKETFSQECKTHFLGLWDTVSSVGWFVSIVKFPSTADNSDLNIVRHAMSIDERRAFFRQNLFDSPREHQDFQQLWFAGVHSDVGGGYSPVVSGLSNIALWWMVEQAGNNGLLINSEAKERMLASEQKEPYPKEVVNKSLKGAWWFTEIWPKIHHKRIEKDGKVIYKTRLRVNLGRPRTIDPATAVFHDSVFERMKQYPDYRPKNIKEFWPK